MKDASEKQVAICNRVLKGLVKGRQAQSFRHLLSVAIAFIESQQYRHAADYDNARIWVRSDVSTLIAGVNSAFQSWNAIREEPAAQAYLISLLGKPRGN